MVACRLDLNSAHGLAQPAPCSACGLTNSPDPDRCMLESVHIYKLPS